MNKKNISENTPVKCPYCDKGYKTVGFWFDNHLIFKHKKNFETKTILIDIIIALVIGILFYGVQHFESAITEENIVKNIKVSAFDVKENITQQTVELKIGQKEIEELIKTKKLSDWNISSCSEIVKEFGSKYSDLQCKAPQVNCESNITIENGSILVNDCDIFYRKIKFYGSNIAVRVKFKPLWDVEDSSNHYLFDIISGGNGESNRISLYTQNGYLKFSIISIEGTEEHVIKMSLKNYSVWNESNFNIIDLGWITEKDRMFLRLNGHNYEQTVGDININLSDADLFLGSSIFGGYQANGYFDNLEIFIPSIKSGKVWTNITDAGVGKIWTDIRLQGDIPETSGSMHIGITAKIMFNSLSLTLVL